MVSKQRESNVTVHKLDPQGNEIWRYDGVLLDSTETRAIVEAWYDRPDEDLHGMLLRQGDRYLETHYSDRWYNVFEIYDVASKQLKGWYCNITRPAIFEDGHIRAVDLALDLLVFPDGRWLVLDEKEFEAMELPAQDRRHAREALEGLIDMAQARAGPFRRHT